MKTLAILLILAHFIGDWALQPRWMATSKHRDPFALALHLFNVSWPLAFICLAMGIPLHVALMALIMNTVLHGVQDTVLWRVYAEVRGDAAYEKTNPAWGSSGSSARLEVKHDYGFYTTIAIDQALHLVILFLLFL
jgi:hypothetical protein